MATTIKPTEADVGAATVHDSRALTELNTVGLLQGARAINWIKSGLNNSSNTGLTATIAAGTAYIDGYEVVTDAADTVGLTANTTNRVWLQLTLTSSKATAAALIVTTDKSVPANAVLCAQIKTGASTVTKSWDFRPLSPHGTRGDFDGTSVNPDDVVLGYQPQHVVMFTTNSKILTWLLKSGGSAALKINGTTITHPTTTSERPLITSYGFDVDNSGADETGFASNEFFAIA